VIREISSGGVVLRKGESGWEIAVIEPQKEEPAAAQVDDSSGDDPPIKKSSAKTKAPKPVFALPKGIVDPGEKPDQTAIREVFEETGIIAKMLGKIADTKYVYTRKWGDQARVFKIVSFYLLMYESGTIDDIKPEMRIEVKRALWMPLADAAKKLSYSTEKKVVRQAQEYVEKLAQSSPD
jgi:8-oxo-dGTP pyrophosphatase MutT (NUDIX family)